MTSGDDKTIQSDAGGPVSDGDEAFCAACGSSYPLTLDKCPKDGARLTKLKAQPDALLGRVFDNRFEVRTSLGQGGMGTVYRGWQITVDREIAIKVIHPKLASDRIAVKRFLREARLSSRLNQPNIVNVYDFGQTEDGILYIAMELLRGHTLGRELEAMRPLPLRRILGIALQLCDALDSAHGQGIVHRDLKPNNIIILDDPPGRDLIKVLDFGLAKSLITDTSSLVTNTNAIIGTPLYMPPEQIEGKPSDQRADLYSFGCILYQMLSGRPPFVGETVNVVLAAHVGEQAAPLPDGLPAAVVAMVTRLMEKDPDKRMRSAREAREVMQLILEGGLIASELNDTTPEVRSSRPDTGPDALAETHHATDSQPGVAPPLSVATSTAQPRRSLRWLAPVLLVAVAAGGVGGYFVMRGRDAKSPAAAPPPAIDAASISVVDAMPMSVDVALPAVDAAMPIDATELAMPDAGSKRPKQPKQPKQPTGGSATAPKSDSSTPPPPTTGSGSAEPQLDFLKSKKPQKD